MKHFGVISICSTIMIGGKYESKFVDRFFNNASISILFLKGANSLGFK